MMLHLTGFFIIMIVLASEQFQRQVTRACADAQRNNILMVRSVAYDTQNATAHPEYVNRK